MIYLECIKGNKLEGLYGIVENHGTFAEIFIRSIALNLRDC